MEKILIFTMLFDFYGELLTKKQKQIFELYYLNDYSLNEISTEYKISRQAVLDSIKRTENILLKYEEKLSLLSKHEINVKLIKKIINNLENLESNLKSNLSSNSKDIFKDLKSDLILLLN